MDQSLPNMDVSIPAGSVSCPSVEPSGPFHRMQAGRRPAANVASTHKWCAGARTEHAGELSNGGSAPAGSAPQPILELSALMYSMELAGPASPLGSGWSTAAGCRRRASDGACSILSFRQKVESPGLSKRRFRAFDWPKHRSACLGLSSSWRNDHTVQSISGLSVPEIWHPAIQLEGSRSLRTHQRAAADDLEERTHLIGPIQQTAGSSRRQRMSFLKHKVGYKVHKGAIQADIDCTVGMAVGPQPQPSRAVMPPNAKSRRIPTLTRTANDARMLTKSYTLRPEAKKLGLTDSLAEGPIQSIILLSSQLWPIPSMSRRVFNSAKLCLSHPFSRMKRIDQWAVDPHPVLTSTTSAKIGKTA